MSANEEQDVKISKDRKDVSRTILIFYFDNINLLAVAAPLISVPIYAPYMQFSCCCVVLLLYTQENLRITGKPSNKKTKNMDTNTEEDIDSSEETQNSDNHDGI